MSKVKVFCTDKDKYVDADILNYKPKGYVDLAMNTVKVRLVYTKEEFVGSMAGLEFILKESNLPREYKEYQR